MLEPQCPPRPPRREQHLWYWTAPPPSPHSPSLLHRCYYHLHAIIVNLGRNMWIASILSFVANVPMTLSPPYTAHFLVALFLNFPWASFLSYFFATVHSPFDPPIEKTLGTTVRWVTRCSVFLLVSYFGCYVSLLWYRLFSPDQKVYPNAHPLFHRTLLHEFPWPQQHLFFLYFFYTSILSFPFPP